MYIPISPYGEGLSLLSVGWVLWQVLVPEGAAPVGEEAPACIVEKVLC